MDLFLIATLVAVSVWIVRARDQRRRIALLADHLGQYQIEKNMETLTQGYLRALGEDDAERREQIFNMLRATEQLVASQFARFAADMARLGVDETQVCKLPVDLPYLGKLFPALTFDLRRAMALHARGIQQAADAAGRPSDKAAAFTMSAELFLMQHTCHWFCRSRTIASARMLTRHGTAYEQLLDAVSPATRQAYLEMLA